jgi:hypothetical protein
MAKRRTMKRKNMKTMKKRRMSKMRKGVKKIIRKSRKMRGGAFADYLPSFLTGKKPQQQNYDMTSESNSGFGNQQRIGAQPIKEYTEEEYTEFRNNPNKYSTYKPVDNITIKEKSSWW